jgi:Zn-dependent protease with chaperone function
MHEFLVLVGFVVVLSLAPPWALRRARWVWWAPRLAITVWLSMAAATMGAMLAAAFVAALALPPVSHGVADLLRACVHRYRVDLEVSADTLVGVAGAITALALPGWVLGRVTHLLRLRTRARRRHRDLLLLAAGAPDCQVLVLDHQRPALYCVPGRLARVVVTSAAVRVLGRDQLAAALEHERGHLLGRHHLLTDLADGMAAALPLPLFRHCREAVRRLVELAADDYAVRVHARDTLAAAIEAVATATAPAASLGASEAALERLTRLLDPPGRLGVRGRFLVAVAVGLTLAMPVLATGEALSHTAANDLCAPVPLAVPTSGDP